jgi:flagellar biosynthetic protein FlhB
MKDIFNSLGKVSITEQNMPSLYLSFILTTAKLILPLLIFVFVIIFISEITQVGFHIATKKFTKGLNVQQLINPFKGLKKIFGSGRSAFELIKSFLKLILVGAIVYQILRSKADETTGLLERPLSDIGSYLVSVSLELILKISLVFIFIAVVDFFYQKYKHKEDMKMTKQEVKEEGKQAEGDPKIKQRMRSLMRQRLRKLMLKNVPKADVVITNPTHFAVALMYKSDSMNAPKVIAKGVDFLAVQIKEIAASTGVPIVEEPPLARMLFYTVEVDQEIPENLFKTVAQVLAYVYNLKHKYSVN